MEMERLHPKGWIKMDWDNIPKDVQRLLKFEQMNVGEMCVINGEGERGYWRRVS